MPGWTKAFSALAGSAIVYELPSPVPTHGDAVPVASPTGFPMFIILLGGIGAIVAAILGFAATKPGAFQIQRSTTMKAAPDTIAAHIHDFHKWTAWSPWENLDPNLQRTYGGAPAGKGAVYAWEGNKQVGAGRMEITDAATQKTTIKLDFFRPFEAHNITEFRLTPRDGSTDVTWSMTGTNPYLMKVFGVFMNMDKMVGNDFEKGLSKLKSVSEQGAAS